MRWSEAWNHVVRHHSRILLLVGFPLFPLLLLMIAAWDEDDMIFH